MDQDQSGRGAQSCQTWNQRVTRCPTIKLSLVALVCLSFDVYSYLDAIERAVANGDTLLLENIGESVDAVLDPLLGRLTIKKGKYIKIGDKEVEYHPNFR